MDLRAIDLADQHDSHLPVSPAMVAGNLLFVSGHVGWDSETRQAPLRIEAQTAQALENIVAVLHAAGASLEHVAKVTVFLTDISDFAAMNQVCRHCFGSHRPARTTVGVAALARPDLLVEIEMVAVLAGQSGWNDATRSQGVRANAPTDLARGD